MSEQPTMEQMRAKLRVTDTLADLQRRIAELHARDCNFPSLADMGEMREMSERFAEAAMVQVRGMFGNATDRILADAQLGQYASHDSP